MNFIALLIKVILIVFTLVCIAHMHWVCGRIACLFRVSGVNRGICLNTTELRCAYIENNIVNVYNERGAMKSSVKLTWVIFREWRDVSQMPTRAVARE